MRLQPCPPRGPPVNLSLLSSLVDAWFLTGIGQGARPVTPAPGQPMGRAPSHFQCFSVWELPTKMLMHQQHQESLLIAITSKTLLRILPSVGISQCRVLAPSAEPTDPSFILRHMAGEGQQRGTSACWFCSSTVSEVGFALLHKCSHPFLAIVLVAENGLGCSTASPFLCFQGQPCTHSGKSGIEKALLCPVALCQCCFERWRWGQGDGEKMGMRRWDTMRDEEMGTPFSPLKP